MSRKKIKVLIVDDTVLYRKIIRDTLASFEEVDVVGTASNGKIALSQITALKPDLVTLDQEMPELNGVQTLRMLKAFNGKMPATVMVSAHTTKDAAVTMQALELGAFDFITKPSGASMQSNITALERQFKPILQAYAVKSNLGRAPVVSRKVPGETPPPGGSIDPETFTGQAIQSNLRPEAVAIGISTGGPKALAQVIPLLKTGLSQPVFIVQHMPAMFTKALADSLNEKSSLLVKEAENGEIVTRGRVYIAPGGKHMKVVKSLGGQVTIEITDDAPENFCKPAADYLFRSVADVYGKKTLGVIMTGMGRDGVKGLQVLKKKGAAVLAQDKKTSIVFGMPMEAIRAGVVDQVAPLSSLAGEINRICTGI